MLVVCGVDPPKHPAQENSGAAAIGSNERKMWEMLAGLWA